MSAISARDSRSSERAKSSGTTTAARACRFSKNRAVADGSS